MGFRLQKIVYDGTTLAFTLPCRPWVPGSVGVGAGVEWAAAGVPAAWVTRRDRTLTMVQRITEAEWAPFRAFLDWAQEGGTFAWYPDASSGTNHTCYLLSPTIDEDVRPQHGDFPGDLETPPFTIRRTDGAAIDVAFF